MITRAEAQVMDQADALAHKASAFHLPKEVIYLDGNSLGVLPVAAVESVKHAVEIEWGRDLITSWNKHCAADWGGTKFSCGGRFYLCEHV
jgi:kynureninase